jgi:hypothetical protein
MGQTSSVHSVTVLADGRHRTVGEYAAYKVARMVARLAITNSLRATLATVKTAQRRNGVLQPTLNQEWEGEAID